MDRIGFVLYGGGIMNQLGLKSRERRAALESITEWSMITGPIWNVVALGRVTAAAAVAVAVAAAAVSVAAAAVTVAAAADVLGRT
jgi:hypothetical protein